MPMLTNRRGKVRQLKAEEVKLLDELIQYLNILPIDRFDTVRRAMINELRRRFEYRRKQEGDSFPEVIIITNYFEKSDKKLIAHVCFLLEEFISQRGLEVEYDQRRARNLIGLLRCFLVTLPKENGEVA